MPENIMIRRFGTTDIININSGIKHELDIFTALKEPELLRYYEPDCGIFIAESPKVIERALDGGYEPLSLLMYKKDITGEARDIVSRCGDIPLYTGEEDEITDITGFRLVRGALCAMRRRELPSAEELCNGKNRIAVLENVVNPTNMGAVFRSAAALGMEAVILTSDCTDPLYRRSTRVSMGTVFQVPWTVLKCSNSQYPQLLHSLGFSMAAMALKEDSVDIDDEKLNSEERLAVIMGTEGEGLSEHTIESCDYTVKIPMYNGVDSLNVAAASAVAFWQLGRKRK